MSARSKIAKALVEKFKAIDGSTSEVNLYGNVTDKMKFWDEVNDYPFVCVVPSTERREYLPGGFKWGFLAINVKVYVKAEDSIGALESVVEEIEKVVDVNQDLFYTNADHTEEISITSITTDEGLLAPLGIGDIQLIVRYHVK
jgi:hypothetical protein